MNQVLEWVKANVFIVVFGVIMLAAPIAMFFVAGGMNQGVRDEVNKRATNLQQLNTLQIEVTPGQQVIPTETLIAQYEKITRTLADDATEVRKQALEFNRKSHKVLMPGVFPEMTFHRREVLPAEFHAALMSAYDQLLSDVKAGSPPGLEDLRSRLETMRNLFITQDLKKDPAAPLDPSEIERLREELSEARLGMYKEAAAKVGMYASKNAMFLPEWDQAKQPPPALLFNWQWQYWVLEDVLKAIASANAKATSVVDAPIKHVLGIVVGGMPAAGGPDAASGSSTPRLSGGFGGEGAGTPPPPPEGGDATGVAAPMMTDPKLPIARDYSASFTGLTSNPLFDVITVEMGLVVETAHLPEVLDALSRYNFNTITNLRVEPADPFAAAEQGFYYGPEPVCTVTLRMETIWFREWTKPFMPPATREALGIPSDAPAGAADDSNAPAPPIDPTAPQTPG